MAPTADRGVSQQLDRAARWARRRRGLAALRGRPEPAAEQLAAALEAGRTRRFEAAETEWIERIERRRSDLERMTDPVRTPVAELSGDPQDREVLEYSVGEVCRDASHPRLWAGILFSLVRRLRPRGCLELGSCLGISAAYQGAALELNGEGRLLSLEGSSERAAIAAESIEELALGQYVEVRAGRFASTLEAALGDVGTIDYAFVDGHHDEEATLEYFDEIAMRAAPGALVVLDDIRWSEGMERAWSRARGDSRVAVSADLGPVGLCLLGEADHLDVSIPIA